jgi:hypothetical protein
MNLLHEAVDLTELFKVELRDAGSDGSFDLNVSEGKYEFLATGGTAWVLMMEMRCWRVPGGSPSMARWRSWLFH